MKVRKTLVAAGLLASMANLAWAGESSHDLSLGLGLIHFSDHYIGENDETLLVPLITYKTERFSLGVWEGASYDFYQRDGLSLNVKAVPRYTTLDGPDADRLQGIDRKTTLDAGVGLDYTFGRSYISASAVAEVTGKHDGFELDAKIGRTSNLGDFAIVYGVGVTWQSKELSNYRFGVRTTEIMDGRPAYSADATIVPYVEFLAEYPLSETWKVVTGGQLSILTGDIKDSPLVGSNESFIVFSGLMREF
jgi:outer membrane protein